MNDQSSYGNGPTGPQSAEESLTGSASSSTGGVSSLTSTSGSDGNATSTAQDEAKHLKESTTESVSQIAGTAMDQTQQVASEVKQQAHKLADEVKSQAQEQATSQRDKAVETLRSFGDELSSMASSRSEGSSSGLATQLARDGSSWTYQAADYLERREPGQLIEEVREFARRRPGTFLVGAAVAGVVVGRLTRGAVAASQGNGSSSGRAEASPSTGETTPYTTPHIPRPGTAAVEGDLPGSAATQPGAMPTSALTTPRPPGQTGGTL
jgi:hypothetical protein